jgi:co-chaperonin GroES (HSP10)
MARNNEKRQEIYLDSIEGYRPYRGMVLIKPVSKEGATTKAGVIVGFDSDAKYVDEEGSHIADMTSTVGTVIALPIHHWTEGYTIENELQVGDQVWFNYFSSLHGTDIWVGRELYRMVQYSGMVAARRGDQLIILNGYVLLEDVEEKKGSDSIWSPTHKDHTRGIIRFMGSKREYDLPQLTDDIDIAIGDEVLLRKGAHIIPMERQKYLATFDNQRMYRRVKRSDIVAVLNSFTQYQI